jgi:hypothetical protein
MNITEIKQSKIRLSNQMSVDKYGRLVIKYSETELAFKSISTIQWLILGYVLLIPGFFFYPLFTYTLEKLELSSLLLKPYLVCLLYVALWLQFNAFILFIFSTFNRSTSNKS